jgi:RNA polymerase sigma-70 factor (ECF subfamily)
MASQRVDLDITQLVAEHHQAVYRYAFRLTGATCDAEDLTQQAFLVAQQKLGQLRTAESARSWLFAMLRNLFLKSHRRKRMLSSDELAFGLDNLPAETPSDDGIDRERLQQALDALSADYRVVLVMFYFEDCAYREIAAQLELPIGTVMSRLARAKAQLREELFALRDATEVMPTVSTTQSRRM